MIKNYIFLGAPGVGKGTMASLLEKENNIKHISTGEIFRQNIKQETDLGKKVEKIISSGEYVPDELTNQIVLNALLSKEAKENGFILDGYPRTMNQAKFLEQNNFDITSVILLEAPDELILKRLISRARGKDDNPEVIKRRLEIYNKETKPLIDFYIDKDLIKRISAEGNIEQNFSNLMEGID